ncbi:MAG: M20/M25/M40 family metallo-hydrolase [Acidobacteriota bacterium]|nr:M20/M25/M40 family metallo-hydrolase [Acidobacteriota bacterium]
MFDLLAWVVTLVVGAGAPQAQGAALVQAPDVAAALARVRELEPWVIDQQISLCEIEAPPFKEQKRAAAYKAVFEDIGLKNVRIDRVGNVLGERAGTGAGPHLVFSAHLDTVFPEGTNVKVTRQGPGGAALKGPGIGDDCRGLAVILGVVRALDDAKVTTPGPITFVGTVGEEGLGDLRGVKHLFDVELKGRIDRFVSVDGTGDGIVHAAVGSRRYRVTFKGPGGHSYGAFGNANPVHALGRAIEAMSNFTVPASPKTTFSVGRVGGGTSVNAIAFEAWMEVDMRSVSAPALAELDGRFKKAMAAALAAENARWNGRGAITLDVTLVGDRPAGRIPDDDPVVRSAVAVSRALGLAPTLHEESTDANVPINLRIPAITIGGGGRGAGAHSLDETFDTTDSWKGTQRALLVAIALAGRMQ